MNKSFLVVSMAVMASLTNTYAYDAGQVTGTPFYGTSRASEGASDASSGYKKIVNERTATDAFSYLKGSEASEELMLAYANYVDALIERDGADAVAQDIEAGDVSVDAAAKYIVSEFLK